MATQYSTNYTIPYPDSSDKVNEGYLRIQELVNKIDSIMLNAKLPILTNTSSWITSNMINSSINLSGSPTTTTPSTSDSSTKIATTAYVNAVGANFALGVLSPLSVTSSMLAGSIDKTKISGTAVTLTDTNIITSGMMTTNYPGHLVIANAAARPSSSSIGQSVYQTDADDIINWVTDVDSVNKWMQLEHVPYRNVLINGMFNVWQRGTTFNPISATSTTGLNYAADRWQMLQATTNTSNAFVRTATTSSDPTGYTYYTRVQRTNALTFVTPFTIQQSIETINVKPLQGKFITLSFWARAGANYSAASGYLVSNIVTGTGTDNTVGNFTTNTVNTTTNNVLTTSWQRFSITTSAVLANTITQLGVSFVFTPVGTAGAADYYDITGIQLEGYSTLSEFEFEPINTTLIKCQRYYFRSTADATNTQKHFGNGFANSATVAEIIIPFPSTMRIAASVDAVATNLRLSDNTTNTALSVAPTNVSLGSSEYLAVVNCTVAAGLTAFRPMVLQSAAAAAGYIGFSAEL